MVSNDAEASLCDHGAQIPRPAAAKGKGGCLCLKMLCGLFGIVLITHAASLAGAFPMRRLTELVARSSGSPVPLLGDGFPVDWWFAFKPTAEAFPNCSSQLTCEFGGDKSAFKSWSLQYVLASSKSGRTTAMSLHSDCLGNGADPVARTFAQVYSGIAANYVIWNDQFYGDPLLNVKPKCGRVCPAPWGHSKGVMAWGEDGTGFVMQVSTPDWPGSGSKSKTRKQGNTLGCCQADNIRVAQHFFALRLATSYDTRLVLQALQRASVATDPSNNQLVKLSSGPADLASLAKQLGVVQQVAEPFLATLSVKTARSQIRLLGKPSGLHVPPWHMVSSLLGGQPLRTATWWDRPEINSTRAGFVPGCWSSHFKSAPGEVQVALTGEWNGEKFSLRGNPSSKSNHAKLGVSLSGTKLAVLGDMNEQGSLGMPGDEPCSASQNGRGGLFFVVEDDQLHTGLSALMRGETADYVGGPPGEQPAPPGSCGGVGVSHHSCHKNDCTFVKQAYAQPCGVDGFGCYPSDSLAPSCPRSSDSKFVV
ncbi:hypothetical protein AK812_SmicGene6409 [Symbiodinium microadriaticum]|uniref:Uncharacterized protein n=1 Tax=Symbiodinium microadriaticum TaxID=2951 RepID=A0A1Q9ER55_SYMMI|nr:hypothetical protein AK812_SmicGene6409 [Symbiodinium microadriaticum]CAE7181691.1 unnamed protein product [Symbiodinium microadriaticum]